MGRLVRATRVQGVVAVAASIILTSAPFAVQAVPITPNPNPEGSIINIINDPFAVNNANPYYNAGTINIDSASTLTNVAGARLINADPTYRVDGTLNNAGRLDNYGGFFGGGHDAHGLNNTGTLNNFAGAVLGSRLVNAVGATVNNYGQLGTSSGPMTNAGTLNNFAGGSLSAGAYQVTNTGTINNLAGARMTWGEGTLTNAVGGTLNNYGSMHLSFARLANQDTFNNFGYLECNSCAVSTVVGAMLNNQGEISIGLGGLVNAGTLMNSGRVTDTDVNNGFVINSGTLISTGSIEMRGHLQTTGQTINNGTMSLSEGVDIQGGALRGTGTITTPVVTLASGAVLAPGDAATLGTLTINGDLQSSGDLWFRLGGLGLGEFDALDIRGDAVFTGGTVYFDLREFSPEAGNAWDFFSADSIVGWDTLQFAFNGLSPDLTYGFSYSDGVQTLRLRSVPEPSAIGLLAIALAAIGLARTKKAGRSIRKH